MARYHTANLQLRKAKKNFEKKMADNIKVVVLEADYAALCRLGLPTSLSLQLQQASLKLADALWTARASGTGFSVNLFWPAAAKATKRGRKKRKVMKTEEVRRT